MTDHPNPQLAIAIASDINLRNQARNRIINAYHNPPPNPKRWILRSQYQRTIAGAAIDIANQPNIHPAG